MIGSGRGSSAKQSSGLNGKVGPVRALFHWARVRCLEVLGGFFRAFLAHLVGDSGSVLIGGGADFSCGWLLGVSCVGGLGFSCGGGLRRRVGLVFGACCGAFWRASRICHWVSLRSSWMRDMMGLNASSVALWCTSRMRACLMLRRARAVRYTRLAEVQ